MLFPPFVLILLCGTVAAVELPGIGNETFPAVIVFGDSIVDTGNNNNLNTPSKCNFPPYGRDFMGAMPTGRFSNGKVASDFIVEEFGIKELLPAYSDPNLQPQDLLTGVSFASGGTGYDPLTPKTVSAKSLSDQIQQFKEYIEKLKGIVGEERTNSILGKSVFIVVSGSNDIANTYFASHIRELEFDVNSYTDLLVTSASNFFKELYELGARRIGASSTPPLGCLPSQITLSGSPERKCAENTNQAAQLFNTKLSAEVDFLGRSLPNSKMVYIDVYNPLLDIIKNPQKYGFEITDEGCCGTGILEVAIFCNQYEPSTCADVSRYVFWDSYHPTESVYKILVHEVLQKYACNFL